MPKQWMARPGALCSRSGAPVWRAAVTSLLATCLVTIASSAWSRPQAVDPTVESVTQASPAIEETGSATEDGEEGQEARPSDDAAPTDVGRIPGDEPSIAPEQPNAPSSHLGTETPEPLTPSTAPRDATDESRLSRESPLHFLWLTFLAGLAVGLLLGAGLWNRFFVRRVHPEGHAGSSSTAFERLVAATSERTGTDDVNTEEVEAAARQTIQEVHDSPLPMTSDEPPPSRGASRFSSLADAFGPQPIDEQPAIEPQDDVSAVDDEALAEVGVAEQPSTADAMAMPDPSDDPVATRDDREEDVVADHAPPLEADDVPSPVSEPQPLAGDTATSTPHGPLTIPPRTAPYDVYGGVFVPSAFIVRNADDEAFAPLREDRRARGSSVAAALDDTVVDERRQAAHQRAAAAWDQADATRDPADVGEAASALDAWIALEPQDVLSTHRLACCELELARLAVDEMEQVRLLDLCLARLQPILSLDDEPVSSTLSMVGEAAARRALLDLSPDRSAMGYAEAILRQALSLGLSDDSDAAWWLHRILATYIRELDPSTLAERARESRERLERGASASSDTVHRDRWLAAKLTGDIDAIERAHVPMAQRRERLRALHARHATAMAVETSPQVLLAWVNLLCLQADAMVGSAAQERFADVEQVVARIGDFDELGREHALATWRLVRSRIRLEAEEDRPAWLDHAQAALQPFIDQGRASLCLEAARLALVRASASNDASNKAMALQQATDIARPLTAVPSVAIPALHVVLRALLALGEDDERRVFVACLQLIAAHDDGESALVLARNAARDHAYELACGYFVRAWRTLGGLRERALLQWRECHVAWGTHDDLPAWRESHRYLSMAGMHRR